MLKGLLTTLLSFFKKPVTIQYPEVKRPVSARFKGRHVLKRYENGNKLYWPIEKSKKVDRIVIHHTAESLEQDADDTTLIRAIYLYHARTKGW